MAELDDLKISLHAATTLCEDILDRFSISDSMREYNSCKTQLKLADETYPSITTALSTLQVKNKVSLDTTKLDTMKVTKRGLNARIMTCYRGLDSWEESNPIIVGQIAREL